MSIRTYALFLFFVLVLLISSTSTVTSSVPDEALDRPGAAQIRCTADEARCWSEGKLLHSNGRCYPALSRGPCREGHWWRLRDESALSVRGRCVRLSCPPDARSTACRLRMRQVAEACPRRPDGDAEAAVYMDATGNFQCGEFPGRVEALHALIQCVDDPPRDPQAL